MKRFEILDLIEELGFQHLATMLDENEFTIYDSIEHLNSCKNECTEEEFPSSVYDAVIGLLDLFYSL